MKRLGQPHLLSIVPLTLVLGCLGTPTPLAPQLEGSVGLPHHGVQTGAAELPASGPGFARYRPRGSAYWAQPELVAAISQAAGQVSETFPGSPPLVLGDLSARHGGKIPRHNSHRSGRDVDLLWYLQTLEGRPVKSSGFLHVDADGLTIDPASGRYYRLDLARQWELLKEFLTSEEVAVQWMFCSRAVEALLIAYARAKGEADDLVWRAETVLLQPSDSLPHDDHIHLRISCTPRTSLSGCEGGGPYWEWLPELPSLTLSDRDLVEIGAADPLLTEETGEASEPPATRVVNPEPNAQLALPDTTMARTFERRHP